MPSLAYHRALWIWQFDQLGEKTIADIAHTARTYAGADIIFVKVMDQGDYMSTYDTSPLAVSSVQSFQQLQREAEAAGVTLIPWVVPGNAAQAQQHAIFAPSPLLVDLELGTGFWTDTAANVTTYLQALLAGDVTELYVSIDARAPQLAALNVESWAHLVTGLLPQLYWTDFQQPENTAIPPIDSGLAALNVPIFPVYPYDGATSDVAAAWADAQQYKPLGCSMWVMGPANTTQLGALAALSLPERPVPILPTWTNNDFTQVCRLLLGDSAHSFQPDIAAAINYLQLFLPPAMLHG